MFLKAAVSAGSLVTMATISRVYAAELDNPTETKTPEKAAPELAQSTETKPKAKDPVVSQLEKLKEIKRDRSVPINQLPLYGEPAATELIYVPEQEEAIRKHVSVVRQAVWKELDRFEGAWTVVKNNYRTGKKYTEDLVQYLREDAGALPRATFITVSGLGGMILGYKGGVLRRTFFAAGGLATSAAICYPPQAIDLSRRSWAYTKGQAQELWKQTKQQTTDDEEIVEAPKEEAKPATKEETTSTSTKDTIQVSDKKEQEPNVQPKKDFGMSKEEDKDMYSTRSS